MENRSTSSKMGDVPVPSSNSDKRLPPTVPERVIPEPIPSLQNSASLENFGLRRSHSVAQSKNIPEIYSSATRDLTNPRRRGPRRNDPMGTTPLKRSQNKTLEADGLTMSGNREGRQFTVGNVGQNGRIYLRYSVWSNSQISDLRPNLLREGSLESSMSQRPGWAGSEYHGSQLRRRHSLSTIGDECQTAPSSNRGELRIVIERPDTEGSESAGMLEAPSLAIPIPHYRLGGFTFTSSGTPILRSSAYTQTSVSDNFRSSTFMRTDAPNVPPLPGEIVSMVPSSYTLPLSPYSRALSSMNPSSPQSSVFYKLKEPIAPSIFDHLMLVMDDPSVVRYAKGTKQLTAATPARIVAQISSDSFMDYELVSDFFLTFRSYLSQSNLLSLLLARLEWAINRLEDDGRVIRIRVFAALRHWILNYFVDDFVPNRDLRIQFCDRLNRMYEEIKRRSKNSYSDVKILIDLKKCWNGRCSLYWNTQESATGSSADDPVVPGGVDGGQTGETSPGDVGEARYNAEIVLMHEQLAASPQAFAPATEKVIAHTHQKSLEVAAEKPASPASSSTIQPNSCSLPKITTKKDSFNSNQAEAPHPMLLASPKLSSPLSPGQCSFPFMSPLWRRPMHAHKRSGSFSDSVRDDRAPLPLSSFETHGQTPFQMLPHTENISRDKLCSVSEPFLLSLGPPSPNFEVPLIGSGQQDPAGHLDGHKSPGPAMRTFIGTIRRALQNRPSGQHGAPRVGSPNESRGKRSPLPKNVAFLPDGYRGRKARLYSRNNTRVDLLCEEAYLSYRKFFKESEQSGPSVSQDTSSDITKEPSLSKDMHTKTDHLAVLRHDSIPSQLTRGSKSIVIVDDTRTGAFMSGGLQISLPNTTYKGVPPSADRLLSLSEDFSTLTPSNTVQDTQLFKDSVGIMFDANVHESEPGSSVAHENGSRGLDRLLLRKYASHESAMTKHNPVPESELKSRSGSSQIPNCRPRSPMLRRRPGGDLRKMQNNLEPMSRSKSISTDDLTETSSVTGSMLHMAEISRFIERIEGIPNPVHHHQRHTLDGPRHMRRSFEAAVAGFAKIPDDEDGGIESALLKLEGKWDKRPPNHGHTLSSTASVDEDGRLNTPGVYSPSSNKVERRVSSTSGVRISSYVESEDSYCSIPLLERGLADGSTNNLRTYDTTLNALSQPQFRGQEQVSETELSLSIEMVEKTESLQQISPHSTSAEAQVHPVAHPYSTQPETDDYTSELSSEISIDVIDGAEATGAPNENGLLSSPIMSFASLGVPTHPLAEPPSPPMTLGRPGPRTSDTCPMSVHQQPLTPDFSPTGITSTQRSKHVRPHSDHIRLNLEMQTQSSPTGPLSTPGHTPFILAYDPGLLARQFAIVEQAALSEVDWKDLVDMRWSHSSQTTLNWVNYLADQDRKGIDMVVARFNLMVKWALSEIVMTTNRTLRASTITKLIHVAVCSRKIRNYATMLQITIALCSVDCTRLVKTWELVPESEKQLLREMELLIQPTRNFYNLRSEMETCKLQEGCIPFVGLYVQDLTYNAQKPAQIASTRDGEPLVNFERYRTAAAIVKRLLQLIDASTKYSFEPSYGLVERCLWIASLADDRIIALSKELE
ncbi:Guanine nucleotide exchange factor lte1 [Emydomyces testavorans]|uniref:Guanine nucleotide exchange factor lte1 n=1 Tax=Emydomyces testavorans TaxID=2070801 RepID=A0AAF0IFJ1_9EURO|nr:Guanine nucleotide exchange factor lte1 [Emydomyces testavorans]